MVCPEGRKEKIKWNGFKFKFKNKDKTGIANLYIHRRILEGQRDTELGNLPRIICCLNDIEIQSMSMECDNLQFCELIFSKCINTNFVFFVCLKLFIRDIKKS
jgi:hypothetical protein